MPASSKHKYSKILAFPDTYYELIINLLQSVELFCAYIYSIAETAKANNLKPYDYFEYLLEEIPKHMEDTDRSFLEDLLPWSENLPAHIRK